MWRNGLLVGLLGVVLAACASGERDYSGPETKGGVGVNIYPDNHRAEILAYQRSYLNDPTGIRGAAITQPALKNVGVGERYVVCVRFDAKASGGGYTGERDYLAIFLAGKLDQMGVTRDQCQAAPYQPFPELERLKR
jgi:hypothetical protein